MLFTIERKIVLAFGVTIAALGLMVGGAWWNISRYESTFRWVDHTHQALYELEALLNRVQIIQIESLRFVITADPSCLERRAAGEKLARESWGRLQQLTLDNAAQQRRLAQVKPLIDELVRVTDVRILLRQREGLEAAAANVTRGE
ncbi:MAG: multi-sensor signal transduction histidine kinase, partial [Verrucomicrobia bacterium]|nr:multi-sensor signal transduction histidine kinase [Verrucomicrobiota bacterium]